ncbi:MAG: sporulation initiation factor Spo0A C-terminal domain-containing protein, partial [Clostridia bacterium]|nr:sporulation initiation factor Spo0A C-terminal domain-containing protein [Clostridia bacterium]
PGQLAAWRLSGQLPVLSRLRQGKAEALARGLLHALGVPEKLRAWVFLPDMVALTAVHPPLMDDLAHRLYPLIARRHQMTPAAVERSLRLCVESTWSQGELARLERFFGSSVDPDRGKPTNREFLFRLQERVTLGALRLRH